MPQFLVAIHHPDNYDPATEGDTMMRDIDALNEEMEAAGVRKFAGGLHHPPSTAVSLTENAKGEVTTTPGAYLKTNEHVGGFWILETKNLEDALQWGRKAVIACRAPVEVRAFY
jgi:hypothetical protein